MPNVVTLRPAQPYEYHPFSDIWPLLEGEAFEDFATDIAANGLQLPILLYQDKILDGRNRDRACIEAGVEPRYEQANARNDAEAIKLVLSLNNKRRHLTINQIGIAAARATDLKSSGGPTRSEDLVSVSDAAKAAGISEPTVKRARAILKYADKDTIAKVERGELSITETGKKMYRDHGRNAVKAKARKQYQRGLPVSARVPMIDISKRRILTPQQVDPEFTGTPNEFTTKYGHVQIETAEERATNRFREWTLHIRKWAKEYRQFPLSAIDVNWLRSPRQRDIDQFLEAYDTLTLVFDNIQSIRDKAKSLKKGEK